MNAYRHWFGPAIPGSDHAAGLLMQATEIGKVVPYFLYRLFNADDILLYVGYARDLKTRFAGHASEKNWWPEVTRKTVALYMSRDRARAAETLAIHDERPVHNIVRPVLAPGDKLSLLQMFASSMGDRDPASLLFEIFAFVMCATPEDVAAWNAHMTITGAKTLGEALGGRLARRPPKDSGVKNGRLRVAGET